MNVELSLSQENIVNEKDNENQQQDENTLLKQKKPRKPRKPREKKVKKEDDQEQENTFLEQSDKIIENIKIELPTHQDDQGNKNSPKQDVEIELEKPTQNEDEPENQQPQQDEESQIFQNDKSHNSNLDEEVEKIDSESPLKKTRKKRRTKEELEGRTYLCDLCGKAYFSYPAMTNHKKTKHVPIIKSESIAPSESVQVQEKKSRGRPKKVNQNEVFVLEYENKIKNFFEDERRKPLQGENNLSSLEIESVNNKLNEIKSSVINKLNTFIQENKEVKSEEGVEFTVKLYESYVDHPILSQVILNEETETDNISSNKNKTIDDTFTAFLKNSIVKTNFDYLENLMLYICLFRESIIIAKQNEEFTKNESSESIPEFCNDFIKFLADKKIFSEKTEKSEKTIDNPEIKSEEISPDSLPIDQTENLIDKINEENEETTPSPFDTSSSNEKIDLIEFIQFFSYWCFTNNYTSSKLSLIFK
jgi:hypothetical protein